MTNRQTANSRPIRRGTHQTKTEEILRTLREEIISGKLKPGASLTMQSVAKEFGYSITPVREAFRALQAEGLLPYRPHRATQMGDLTIKQVEDLYALRELVESEAAGLAAEKMSAQTFTMLKRLESKLESAHARGRDKAIVSANVEWHRTLYDACDNFYLIDTIHRLLRLYPRHAITKIHGRVEQSIEEHQAIMHAIEARSGTEARERMRAHLHGAGMAMLRYLEHER
jgi:DNA-binding GntR family transcriptional regulator